MKLKLKLRFLSNLAPDAADAPPSPPPKHDAVQQPRPRVPVWNASAAATDATSAAASAATTSAEPRLWALQGAPSAGKQAFMSLSFPP